MKAYLVFQIAALAILVGMTIGGCVSRKTTIATGGAIGAVLMLGSIFLQLTPY